MIEKLVALSILGGLGGFILFCIWNLNENFKKEGDKK